jgi:hypothetical protein
MVQPKYSPEEALERVKLMMKYDTSKTLSEQQQPTLNTSIDTKIPQIGGVPVIKPSQNKKPETQSSLPAWTNNYPCLLNSNLGKTTPVESNPNEVLITTSDGYEMVFYSNLRVFYVEIPGEIWKVYKGSWSCKNGKIYIQYDDGTVFDGDKVVNAKDATKQLSKSAPNSTQKSAPNSTQNPSSNSAQLPPDLKDVKDFQDWLDINAKGWATGYKDGKLSQGAKNPGFKSGGYGKFGPRTQKAWGTYKDQYLKKTGTEVAGTQGTIPPKTDITANKPDEIEQVDADDSTDILI